MIGPQPPSLGIAHLLEKPNRLLHLPGPEPVRVCQVAERNQGIGMVGPQLLHLGVAHLLEEFDRLRQLPDAE